MITIYPAAEMEFLVAKLINQLAVWQMFGRGGMTVEIRDLLLAELEKMTLSQFTEPITTKPRKSKRNADRAAAPK